MRDDIDYVPTRRFVLWGHHFTAVAGAAPIVGPAIAVIWGWLPAFLWVVLGTMFFAGIHDFGSIWVSVRNRAQSVGALSGTLVSSRARALFMIIIFLLILIVNAVFAVIIAQAFVTTPSSVIPAWSAIVVAVVIGVLLYRVGVGLFWPTLIGVLVLYAVIFLGEMMPVALPERLFGLQPNAQWILILFAYAGIASMLPVWLLLQPRDYINGIQLFVGLGLLFGAIVIVSPTVVAPAINPDVPPGAPPIIPLLFVTIACGAISGFHGLVGSGTTSKQLSKEPDARFVGYLGSLGEGALAIVSIIVASAGFASLAEWKAMYSAFGEGGMTAFIQGGSTILGGVGIATGPAQTLLAVMAVLFAGTTMDASVRLQRYIIQEWGVIYRIPQAAERVPRHDDVRCRVPDPGLRRGWRRRGGRHGALAPVRSRESAAGRPDAARHQHHACQAGSPVALYDGADGLRDQHVVPIGPVPALGVLHERPVFASLHRHPDSRCGGVGHAGGRIGVRA